MAVGYTSLLDPVEWKHHHELRSTRRILGLVFMTCSLLLSLGLSFLLGRWNASIETAIPGSSSLHEAVAPKLMTAF